MEHFTEWCGLPKESFTGHWDMGHKLQLVFADVLKKNADLAKFFNIVDDANPYCRGKDGLLLI